MATEGDRIQAARPTIKVGGREDASLAQGLLGLLVIDAASGMARCEATFGNWGPSGGEVGFRYFDRQTLDFGKALAIEIAGLGIFDGRITALEGGFAEGGAPEITVLAEDRLQDLRMTRRSRTFEQVSDAGLVQRIASDHGLTPDVDLTGPTHAVIAQVNQSDLALVHERARGVDADVWIEGTTLHAKARARRTGTPIELRLGTELRECRVLADLAHQRSSVTAGGWDVSGKQALRSKKTDSVLSGELCGGSSGPSILATALGTRDEVLAHAAPATAPEAEARAEAHLRSIARRFVTARALVAPDGRLRAGKLVKLTGIGPLFSGTYFLTEVRHLFDGARGLRAEITAEAAGLGQR